jgi:hypothetical protein
MPYLRLAKCMLFERSSSQRGETIPDHQRAKNEQLLRDAGRRATVCPADVTSVAVVHCYTQPGLHSS